MYLSLFTMCNLKLMFNNHIITCRLLLLMEIKSGFKFLVEIIQTITNYLVIPQKPSLDTALFRQD